MEIFDTLFKKALWLVLPHVKGSQLCVFPWTRVCCYIEFKLRYLRNLKLISIGINWTYSFVKKNRWDFARLKAFSWILYSNFKHSVIDKIYIFPEIASNFTYKNCNLKIRSLKTNCFYPENFMAVNMFDMYFFTFS